MIRARLESPKNGMLKNIPDRARANGRPTTVRSACARTHLDFLPCRRSECAHRPGASTHHRAEQPSRILPSSIPSSTSRRTFPLHSPTRLRPARGCFTFRCASRIQSGAASADSSGKSARAERSFLSRTFLLSLAAPPSGTPLRGQGRLGPPWKESVTLDYATPRVTDRWIVVPNQNFQVSRSSGFWGRFVSHTRWL